MDNTGNYCSSAKFDLFKKPVETGDDIVLSIIIDAPAGFGEHLKKNAVLSIRSGLDEEGRAIILEIIGHIDELNKIQPKI